MSAAVATTSSSTTSILPTDESFPAPLEASTSPVTRAAEETAAAQDDSAAESSSVAPSTSSSILVGPPLNGVPESASQQAPRPVVLRKKAKSLVSRLIARPSRSSSFRVSNEPMNSSRSSRQPLQRSRSATLSNRLIPFAPSVPGSRIAPLSKPGMAEAADAKLPWNRFRRQSTMSTLFSQSRMDMTENSDDDDEVILFQMSSSGFKTKQPYEKLNVLQWLTVACPTDVLPHVLAFCGPQLTQQLQGVNRFWFKTIGNEATWRIMCQDLYKWTPGNEEPASWKQYYRENPCVPVDYKTVHRALDANTGENVRVWLRPGKYVIKEPIQVDRTPQHKVTVASMMLPDNIYQPPPELISSDAGSACTVERKTKKRRGKALLKLILCTGTSYNDAAMEEDEESVVSEPECTTMQLPPVPTRATIVMRSSRLNQPAIRVQRGHFAAENLDIEHSSNGLDIWNGNAAIQIQPPQPEQRGPPPVLPREELPVANLSGLRVTSKSGRGVVTIDGGQLTLKDSSVYDCAATGVYIGGRGTQASLSTSDVLRNGLGSRGRARRNGGIARNHSGIYLEQGVAEILDCNVSNNTLTGITAVSTDNATLLLRDSDLQGNGSFQLEIPSRNARGITMQQNRLESSGTGRIRAILDN